VALADALPLLLPLGAAGVIVFALFFEGSRRQVRAASRQTQVACDAGAAAEQSGPETAMDKLNDLPDGPAAPEIIDRIMRELHAGGMSLQDIHEALRWRYRGRTPVLQASIWIMEQPGYTTDPGQPRLHERIVSAILLKKDAAAMRLLLDRVGDGFLDIDGASRANVLETVLSHAENEMRAQDESALAERLREMRRRAVDRRTRLLLDILPELLADIRQPEPLPGWTDEDAARASWPIARALKGASNQVAAALFDALDARREDEFSHAALINAVGLLTQDSTLADIARTQAVIEAGMRNADSRVAANAIGAALYLAEDRASDADVVSLAGALSDYRAAGGSETPDTADLDECLTDIMQHREKGSDQ
jgi:hypothetical protein